MGKQHETMPTEPQEAPARQPKPEFEQPSDPDKPSMPQEAPQNEPTEVPQRPDLTGSAFNQTEV